MQYEHNGIEVNIPDRMVAKWITDISFCADKGTEEGHIYADGILCEILSDLGLKSVADEFEKLDKWYS